MSCKQMRYCFLFQYNRIYERKSRLQSVGFYLIVIMCALFPSSLIAQSPTIKRPSHRINGIVQDATTKEALPFATVGLFKKVYDRDSLVRGVTANENGEFVMLNVASGEVKIQISFIGYGVFEKMLLVKENTDLGMISLQQDR